jgi:ferric iron reductase protein FhuF
VTTFAAALRSAAALGPYFSVELAVDGPDWLELTTLADDPARLHERVATTRRLLAESSGRMFETVDERATASIYFLGLSARLVSPALGAAVVTGSLPLLAMNSVHWRPTDVGPIPIAMTGNQTREASTVDELADLLYSDVVSTTVTPVAVAVQREFRLSPKVVWGNVTSSIAGAAKMLGLTRPDLAERSTELADRLLQRGLLTGTGHYVRVGPDRPERQFVRNNCCLFYRIPGGGTCADCVLVSDAARQAMWRNELGRT